MKKVIFSVIIALGIISSKLIAFEYICEYPEVGPKFYGFPFVQQTNTSWIFSMSGDIYLVGFLGNLMFWSILICLLSLPLNNVKKTSLKKGITIVGYVMICCALLVSYINFAAIDWRIKRSHDDFKIDYYTTQIDCERTLMFWNF